MMILVAGANSSGKSLFAERLISGMSGTRCYIATMIPCGSEGAARVARHRQQRADLGFVTLELPCSVSEAALPDSCTVLLEDASNLLANAVFEQGGTPESVYDDIRKLEQRCRTLVVVTIGGLCETEYNGETRAYIRSLNRLNGLLRDRAQLVFEMHERKPLLQKQVRSPETDAVLSSLENGRADTENEPC